MNSDMAFCWRTGRASIGVVGRDEKSVVIISSWHFLWHCSSPEEAEAEACLEGFRLAIEWIRQYPIAAETDCACLVETLRSCAASRSKWAGVLDEIQGLRQLLLDCIIQHVGRDANTVAHQLARRALEREEWVVLRDEIPI
jgi:ribonuclease HI